jgi:NAD(P)-dependent dehydrogenase (short-subunit alcohol dehydrogenase family)
MPARRDLDNRVALVTGASRGIGASIAIALAVGADISRDNRSRRHDRTPPGSGRSTSSSTTRASALITLPLGPASRLH